MVLLLQVYGIGGSDFLEVRKQMLLNLRDRIALYACFLPDDNVTSRISQWPVEIFHAFEFLQPFCFPARARLSRGEFGLECISRTFCWVFTWVIVAKWRRDLGRDIFEMLTDSGAGSRTKQ